MTSVEQVKIPEGYKQTEVGVIPEDWKCIEASEAMIFIGGYGFSSSLATTVGVKWLKIANVGLNEIKWDAESFLPEKLINEYKDFLLKPSDVVMALTRPILNDSLKVARISETDIPALLNQRVAKLEPKSYHQIDYLYYVVQRLNFVAAMNLAMAGTDPPNIGTNALAKIKIVAPETKKEQSAIANALSDVDSLIASLETLIAKKSAIKTAAMQQLLTGKKRLPAFDKKGVKQGSDQLAGSGSTNQATQTKASNISDSLTKSTGQTAPRPGYKQTELGEIPEDWEVVGLGYLFENKVIRKRISGRDDVTFISMQDVSESAKINNSHKVKYADVKSGFTYFERNDVLVAKITPCFENGKGAYTDILETEVGFGSTEFHVLRATPNVDSKYLYYFTNTERFRKELEGEMVGSAGHRRVPLSSIQNYQVAISLDKEEQTAIANVLSDMDNELDALQQRLTKTQKIKQGMMQELLTGKTRLV